jgi:hypothetical protein
LRAADSRRHLRSRWRAAVKPRIVRRLDGSTVLACDQARNEWILPRLPSAWSALWFGALCVAARAVTKLGNALLSPFEFSRAQFARAAGRNAAERFSRRCFAREMR